MDVSYGDDCTANLTLANGSISLSFKDNEEFVLFKNNIQQIIGWSFVCTCKLLIDANMANIGGIV